METVTCRLLFAIATLLATLGQVLASSSSITTGTTLPPTTQMATETAAGQAGIALVAVQSRKIHGTAGPFDIAIDTTQTLNGNVTVESRAIGTGHTLVFQFNAPVTSPGIVTVIDSMSVPLGMASVIASGNDAVVTLTDIPDKQLAAVTLTNVNNAGLNVTVAIGFFVGGVRGSVLVTAMDIQQVKSRSGQASTNDTFRHDVNTSGNVNAGDIVAVRRRSNVPLMSFTVGGTIAGLAGNLVLQNNGTDNLARSTNGSFLFSTSLVSGASYAVTVQTQPAGQTCSVSNGTGAVANTHVANVVVSCVAITYSLSGSISGSVTANVRVALSGTQSTTVLTDVNGNYTITNLIPGNYMVTPIHPGHIFNPPIRTVPITSANSPSNNFTSSLLPMSVVRPIIGIFPSIGFINLPPATRDLADGTLHFQTYTILLPDNCPRSFTIANLGPLGSTLEYVVSDDGALGGFLDATNEVGLVNPGNGATISVTVDPRFTTSDPPLIGASLILSVYTPQATNFFKSIVGINLRSKDEALIGTWGGSWSGVGFGIPPPGNPTPTTPVNGNWTLQIDSVNFTTGAVGGTFVWTGTDAVWSDNGLVPSALPVNNVVTLTPANSAVQAVNFGCGLVKVLINRNVTNPPTIYGPGVEITVDLLARTVDQSSLFHTNPVWPGGRTGLSSGNLTGAKNP